MQLRRLDATACNSFSVSLKSCSGDNPGGIDDCHSWRCLSASTTRDMITLSSSFNVFMWNRVAEMVDRRVQRPIRETRNFVVSVSGAGSMEGVNTCEMSGKSASQSSSQIADGRPSSNDSFLSGATVAVSANFALQRPLESSLQLTYLNNNRPTIYNFADDVPS